MDVEVEALRFCSRVDLDKLQLVSKGKRILVDGMSHQLSLHNVHLAKVSVVEGFSKTRCMITYSTVLHYDNKVPTGAREELLQRGNGQDEVVPSNPYPLRRLRNAYVGRAEFWPSEEFTPAFKVLLSDFISRHKGAMLVGFVRLLSGLNG